MYSNSDIKEYYPTDVESVDNEPGANLNVSSSTDEVCVCSRFCRRMFYICFAMASVWITLWLCMAINPLYSGVWSYNMCYENNDEVSCHKIKEKFYKDTSVNYEDRVFAFLRGRKLYNRYGEDGVTTGTIMLYIILAVYVVVLYKITKIKVVQWVKSFF